MRTNLQPERLTKERVSTYSRAADASLTMLDRAGYSPAEAAVICAVSVGRLCSRFGLRLRAIQSIARLAYNGFEAHRKRGK